MQPTNIYKVVLQKEVFYFQLGGSIDGGYLGENTTNSTLLWVRIIEGVVPHFWITPYTASLSGEIP